MTFPALWAYVMQKLLSGLFKDFFFAGLLFAAAILLYMAGLVRHRHVKRSRQSVLFLACWNLTLSVITFLLATVILAALFATFEVAGMGPFVARHNAIVVLLLIVWLGPWGMVTVWLGMRTSRLTRADPEST